ncbi:acyl-homoserine-lactone synthase [Pararhizobium haloflavum]|uniref:acyl-homoserine-lactone synthase n=1 Tax=Pararhizobium haloflavum TaxID=2037914 RepID=UPI000C1A14E7|nr:acyl-homoserine-lactone synthase [Pararhizobium haloflavum]
MFQILQAPYLPSQANLLDRMFRLRKRVFVDQLQWSVSAINGRERDCYDDCQPVYILWTDDLTGELLGSTRLMPTTGPTLMYDVFRDTFPHGAALEAPGIWEATRTCVDAEALARCQPDLSACEAFGRLCLAIVECGLQHGIHTVVSNYEPHMMRIYRKAGLIVDELGRADGYGRRPVCCGAFAITTDVAGTVRAQLGVSETLITLPAMDKMAA